MRAALRRGGWTAAALLLLGACAPGGDEPREVSPAELGRILGVERPFEARLSFARGHAPCGAGDEEAVPFRCASPPKPGSREHSRVLRLAGEAGALADAADPRGLWVLGLIELIWADAGGNPPEVSVQRLTEASLLAPDEAGIHVDLATAHLARYGIRETPADLLHALEGVATALELEPEHSAALFNLALIKEKLGLVPAAMETWERVAEVEPGTGWAREGGERAERLAIPRPHFDGEVLVREGAPLSEVRALAEADPRDARQYVMDHALPEWGEAVLAGDSATAAARLAFARAVADAFAERPRDRSVEALLRLASTAEEGERERIAGLFAAYGAAREPYGAGDFGGAIAAFGELEPRLTERDEPLRGWVHLYHGAVLMNEGDAEAGEVRFRTALEANDPDSFPSLAGQVAWVRGLSEGRAGFAASALEHYLEAVRRFEAAGDRSDLAAARSLAGSNQVDLGEWREGLAQHLFALSVLGERRGSTQLHNQLLTLADLAHELGHSEAAILLQREGVLAAKAAEQAVTEAEARIRLAGLLLRVGGVERVEEGLQQLARATELADRVESATSRAWLRADLLSLAGDALLLDGGEPAAALLGRLLGQNGSLEPGDEPEKLVVGALDEAAAYFESVGRVVRLLPVLGARGEAHLRLGMTEAGERDLRRVLDLMAREEEDRDDPVRLAALREAARPAVESLVALRLSQGRPVEALAYARGGLGVHGPDGEPADAARAPREIAAPLPAGAAALAYAVLGDTLAVWALRDGSVRVKQVAFSRGDLDSVTERIRVLGARGAGADALSSELEALHQVLVEPVARWLDGADALVVVPDAGLHGVPFSALKGPDGYLAERASVRVAPALQFTAAPHSGAIPSRAGEMTGQDVLLVGAPEAAPGLPALPGAFAEVEALRALYPGASVARAGRGVGPSELIRRLSDARVFHFAGHAVSDPTRAEGSHLHLGTRGPSSEEAVELTAQEIRELSLERLDLVVLSACRTLTGAGTRPGGFDGIAQSFLAAGAAGVLGTLWEVEDAATRELVVRFHEAYRGGASPEEALRSAQLALLRSEDPTLSSPAAWAGFRYVGR